MRGMNTTAIRTAADVFGGQAALARRLEVKPPTVNQWCKGDRRVPAELCPLIERATRERGNVVRCEELRPDVAWDVLRMQAEPLPEATAAAAEAGG